MTTEDVPATSPPLQPLTFAENVASLSAPRNWLLHAWNARAEEASEEPQVIATLPVPDGVTIEQHMANAGCAAGRWRVALAPVVTGRGRDRHRLDRAQRRGAVSDVVVITPEHVAQRTRQGGAPAGARRDERPAAPRSPGVLSAIEAAAIQRAENDRLAAELEGRRLRQQLAALDGERPTPPPAGAGILAALAPIAPVVVDIVRSWLENQRRTTEALVEAVQSRAEAPAFAAPVAAPASPGITLESLLQLVPHLKDLRKFLGSLGGGGDDAPEPAGNDTVRMIEGVRDLLTGIRGAAAAAPAAEQPPAAPAAPAPRPRPKLTPEQAMNFRVQRFLLAVFAEQQATSDPAHAADKLFPSIGALPERFRMLLATSSNVEALLSGLPEWLPGPMKTSVPNGIRQDAAKRAWLETFLSTVREIAENAGADS